MRIISQDGFYDLPYENVGISLNANNRNQVIAWSASDFCKDDLYSVMGNYSTEAKAQKAMEVLRDAYLSRMELDGGYDTVHRCYIQPNYWVLPKVFQFPKDEDLEE